MSSASLETAVVTEASPADPPVMPPAPTLGALLIQRRQALGLSLEDAAISTKYSVKQLAALEADDFAALPKDILFIKGMLRSVARSMHMEAEPLLQALQALHHSPHDETNLRLPTKLDSAENHWRSRLNKTHKLWSIAALFLLMLTLIIGGMYWIFDPQPARSLPQTSTAELMSPTTPALSMADKPSSPNERIATIATTDTTSNALHLDFSFAAPSWLEVKNAHNKIIFSGINAANSHRSITGTRPLTLVIGNASKVKLHVDAQVIDLQKHTSDTDVARLILQ